MSVILILILVSIVVAGLFLVAFFWAVHSGQYDDTYSPSVRMLFEDKKPKKQGAVDQENRKTGDQGSGIRKTGNWENSDE